MFSQVLLSSSLTMQAQTLPARLDPSNYVGLVGLEVKPATHRFPASNFELDCWGGFFEQLCGVVEGAEQQKIDEDSFQGVCPLSIFCENIFTPASKRLLPQHLLP